MHKRVRHLLSPVPTMATRTAEHDKACVDGHVTCHELNDLRHGAAQPRLTKGRVDNAIDHFLVLPDVVAESLRRRIVEEDRTAEGQSHLPVLPFKTLIVTLSMSCCDLTASSASK